MEKEKPKGKRKNRLVRRLWKAFFAFILFIVLFLTAINYNFLNLFGDMPGLERLENPKSELASEIYSEDNVLIGKYFRENRSPVEYEELSPNLINALIATEDARFFKHSGIDFRGTLRVMFKTILMGRKGAGGGSTLTQQLAKNLFDTREEEDYKGLLSDVPLLGTVVTKLKEWIIAVRLEQAYTKKEILFMYLNTVDFGSNAFGIKVASKTFFGKAPGDLNIQEAAVLVGLLKAPTLYSPVLNPENALARRNTVLYQMMRYGYLTREEFDSIAALPIDMSRYKVENHNSGMAPYFRDAVRDFLKEWAKENGYDLYSDGLKIYTTINSKMQRYAEEAVDGQMQKLQKLFYEHWRGANPWIDDYHREIKDFMKKAAARSERYRSLKEEFDGNIDSINYYMNKKIPMKVFSWTAKNHEKDTVMSPMDSIRYYKYFLHTGFMSMDPKTGYVKAWVGGVDHRYFQYDHVKQGTRQPGSTFKPIVYTAAIDQGYSPCFTLVDEPVKFGKWIPQNSNGKFSFASLTLRQALSRSINSITAGLTKRIGPQQVVKYGKLLGIESPLEAVPSICLGVEEVSVYELVGAYSTFANKGVWTRPLFVMRIEDKNGNILKEFYPETREAISEETAYIMLYMMKGVTEPGGTAARLAPDLKTNNDIAAKTGTTQNNSDGWFMGITKDLVSGAWVGGEERSIHFRSTALGQGAATALPIWEAYMKKIYADPNTGIRKGLFEKPSRISTELNCSKYWGGINVPDSLQPNDTYVKPKQEEFDN